MTISAYFGDDDVHTATLNFAKAPVKELADPWPKIERVGEVLGRLGRAKVVHWLHEPMFPPDTVSVGAVGPRRLNSLAAQVLRYVRYG